MVIERTSGSSASARGKEGAAEQPAPLTASQRSNKAHACEYWLRNEVGSARQPSRPSAQPPSLSQNGSAAGTCLGRQHGTLISEVGWSCGD